MHFQLVCLEVHLRVKYNELLLHALSVWAQEVVFSKVHLKRIVVDIVLLLPAPTVLTIADVAAFVFVPTMRVELVVPVEALATEATFRMSLESALIDRARVIVAELLMFAQIRKGKQLVLVGEDFLVARAEITRQCQSAIKERGRGKGAKVHTTSPWCAPS